EVSMRRENCTVWNCKARAGPTVAVGSPDEPAAYIHRRKAGVVQLDELVKGTTPAPRAELADEHGWLRYVCGCIRRGAGDCWGRRLGGSIRLRCGAGGSMSRPGSRC